MKTWIETRDGKRNLVASLDGTDKQLFESGVEKLLEKTMDWTGDKPVKKSIYRERQLKGFVARIPLEPLIVEEDSV